MSTFLKARSSYISHLCNYLKLTLSADVLEEGLKKSALSETHGNSNNVCALVTLVCLLASLSHIMHRFSSLLLCLYLLWCLLLMNLSKKANTAVTNSFLQAISHQIEKATTNVVCIKYVKKGGEWTFD